MLPNLTKKKSKLLIIETPKQYHKIIIYIYLLLGYKIYIIEPFHTYHHINVDVRFYPKHLPSYIKRWIIERKVSLIKADQLNAREIYPRAAHKAVETVEIIYPIYKKKNSKIIEFISNELNSNVAEDIYKKDLSDRLGVFYSMNILVKNIHELGFKKIKIILENDILLYKKFINYAEAAGVDIFDKKSMKICFWSYVFSIILRLKRILLLNIKILAQAIISTFHLTIKKEKTKKKYKYGITIISDRQLRGNERSADFLVDGEYIHSSDVVFLPLFSLNPEQKKQLAKLKGDNIIVPGNKRHFSNRKSWYRILIYFSQISIFYRISEVEIAARAIAEYNKWKSVLRNLEISNFITHADFGNNHIVRNIALKEHDIKTWYFIDSMNSGSFGDKEKGIGTLHPFWDYLTYDFLISWSEAVSKYYLAHHNNIKEVHTVGCMWATKKVSINNNHKKNKVIAAFDTTYTRNSFTSYEEGILYTKHLIKIVENNEEIELYFKEKKQSNLNYHLRLDPELGPKLFDLYNEMYLHPRIHQFTNKSDVSEIINNSDLIISFPFTSTTFEALSGNKYAIWHDPMELYRNTEYGKLKNVTTHGFLELESLIEKLSKKRLNIIKANRSDYFDPYSDYKATERFRKLLVGSGKEEN